MLEKQCQHWRKVSSSPASLVVTEISNGRLHLLHSMSLMILGLGRCSCIFANPDGQVSVYGFHLGFNQGHAAGGEHGRDEFFFRNGFFGVVEGWADESHGFGLLVAVRDLAEGLERHSLSWYADVVDDHFALGSWFVVFQVSGANSPSLKVVTGTKANELLHCLHL
jgi:hypothetical protein